MECLLGLGFVVDGVGDDFFGVVGIWGFGTWIGDGTGDGARLRFRAGELRFGLPPLRDKTGQ